jgi:hypothetical protein
VAVAAVGLALASVLLARLDAASSGPRARAKVTDRGLGKGVVHPNQHYCDGCKPPLVYLGGPVVNTSGKGFTVTPVYWLPQGYSLPTGYMSTINSYVANVAAASGRTDNVYSIASEYYAKTSSGRINLRYRIAAGKPVVDTNPFPPGRCELQERRDSVCISDGQLTAELARLVSANGLPTGLGYFYPVFFPNQVETSDGDSADSGHSGSDYCAYHSSFGRGKGIILYGNEPFVECDQGQAPNGSLFTDGAIDTLSHELIETITDPSDDSAWRTAGSDGSEVADICTEYYGIPLGSTSPGDPGSSQYNQVINGGKYYTQSEFSNSAYKSLGVGNGCALSEGAIRRGVVSSRLILSSYLSDISLPADGGSTSTDHVWVTDKQGYAVRGDAIAFSEYVVAGNGVCGTLDKKGGKTDADGAIDVVYTASTDDVECAIVASEAKGGKSVTSPVYQGSYGDRAPAADDTIPESLKAGQTAVFTVTFDNRGDDPIRFGTVDFEIWPDSDTSPHHWWRFTFRVTLSAKVPSLGQTPMMDFEAYLDQLNPASATYTTLADTGYTAIGVTPAG